MTTAYSLEQSSSIGLRSLVGFLIRRRKSLRRGQWWWRRNLQSSNTLLSTLISLWPKTVHIEINLFASNSYTIIPESLIYQHFQNTKIFHCFLFINPTWVHLTGWDFSTWSHETSSLTANEHQNCKRLAAKHILMRNLPTVYICKAIHLISTHPNHNATIHKISIF